GDLQPGIVAALDHEGLAHGLLRLTMLVTRTVLYAHRAFRVERVGRGDVGVGLGLVAHRQACDFVPDAEVALQVDRRDGHGLVGFAHWRSLRERWTAIPGQRA